MTTERVSAMALALLLVAGTSGVEAAGSRPQTLDFSDRMTPTCELAGVVALPPAGWFNVPFEGPPKGHLGCQMMRTDASQELVGIVRVRSVSSPAAEFAGEEFDGLLASEYGVVETMGYRVADEPLWVRDKVPVSGPGFGDGRAVGVAASIEGNDVPQEVHFLVFRSDEAKYLLTLLTPAGSYKDGAVYERNVADFGQVIRTLQLPE